MNMGCTPSLPPSTAVKPADNLPTNPNIIFTIDERLKLKEVWVVVKQSNFKKLGDEIMSRFDIEFSPFFSLTSIDEWFCFSRALEKNSALMKYWQHSSTVEQANNFHFDEHETFLNNDLLMKQAFKQHGSKLLDKIDQLIMVMVTKVNTTNSNDTILNDYFQRIGQTHSTFKIQQDHIDVSWTMTNFVSIVRFRFSDHLWMFSRIVKKSDVSQFCRMDN